jgi:hypothetical protein
VRLERCSRSKRIHRKDDGFSSSFPLFVCRPRILASWLVDLLERGDSLAGDPGENRGYVMKSSNVSIRRTVVAVKTAAAAAFALTLAVVIAGTSQAENASKDGSSWNMIDSVLVLPPVYRSDVKSAPAEACAEDCPDSSNQGSRESPSAVAGTADDPADASAGTADNPAAESAGADRSTPDASGWQEQQATAGSDPQSADGLEGSLGSVQDYEEQQVEEAAELSNYGIVRAPSVIFAVPIRSYYAPRTFSSAAPVVRVAPRPSIVPRGVPRTVGGFPGGSFGGFRGGGFSHTSGFHGGFRHR